MGWRFFFLFFLVAEFLGRDLFGQSGCGIHDMFHLKCVTLLFFV